jgi:hypothetical protein
VLQRTRIQEIELISAVTVDFGHNALRKRRSHCAVISVAKKGEKEKKKQDRMTPLGYGGRLRPPLFSVR